MRRTMRSAAAAAGALALAGTLAACGGSGGDTSAAGPGARTMQPAADAQPSAGTVAIKTFMYDPDPLRVKAGTKVTWTNRDDILHTVTDGKRGEPTGAFDAKIELGEKFSHTFEKAGTYSYVCTIHAGMDGSVVVT